ncbi:Hypothetical predicted protein [Paramuricea clavata]|uniref:Uncharacterized protein n=1 Tax=Paramuricea clavata TaxID=317549 RepID=A0A6S7GMZ1_PARCT|nr:Hypothetical predicted protein [Paramuricea clavata]
MEEDSNSKYEKLTLGDDGSVVRSEFVVEGHKQPLTVVWEHFLKSHACYMRNVSDKEFSNMSKQELTKRLSQKAELQKELNSRKVYKGETVDDMKKLLTDKLHGVQRVPALLYPNPLATLALINSDKYEILPFEPLHDVGKHIKNILIELPMHVSQEEATIINETIEFSLGNEETK